MKREENDKIMQCVYSKVYGTVRAVCRIQASCYNKDTRSNFLSLI